MKFREHLASGVGVLGLAVDAGIALASIVVAVPVAFIVSEVGKDRAQARRQTSPTVPPASTTHDLGTVFTYRERTGGGRSSLGGS
ncbi:MULTISPECIES: hypothetical protein [Rhodococcus]|jgi:hypothetical protein|uniref:Uncharacterized protein n=1 Tax=Rhodococcus jostii (strain RHA1) TaxID=101510 RepID=Q0SIW6_RHOJR|nr:MULTISPECIES: hypothetical protein [Rhodococcus]ABG92520.1 conserved hypothetical protein [Rhodococcus jostii RHA1]